MNTFVRGQRWLSETQPELGLGLIEAVEHRRVHLLFPATGERRTYATDVAPLARARFAVGDAIRDLAGNDWVVTGVSDEGPDGPTGPARTPPGPASGASDGLLIYQVRDAAGRREAVPEGALDPRLRLNRPQQRLLAARLDSNAWFRLRLATWRQRQQAATSPVRGLVGARMQPIPHQLYIAAEVADRAVPRVLLADEVGLGKTIEAGLILHRLLLQGRVQRVLILVPDALLHQWLVELLRRFNLRFALFDRARLAALNTDTKRPTGAGSAGNPFDSEQRVLCSLDLLTVDPANAAAALAGHWDLLIVDEAHHLHWTPTDASPAYQLVAGLAARTPGVLLLTATPEQLGRAGHFGRLRLLDPDRFGDYDAFLAEEAGYAPVAEIAARLLDGLALHASQQQRLDALIGAPYAALDRDETVARLLDRHGTSRILFRNTRAAIAGFPERRLHSAPLVPSADAADPQPKASLAVWPERGWGELAAADDPRLPWLIETLRRLRPAKVLLITAQVSTVLALRRTLLERAGIHGAVFHEGMEIVERDRAAAFFADPDEGSPVLLCSEIGSEGRNFQFVHHLILFDLPLDPELLEQRIGRLDRIGQTHAVDLHVPYLSGSAGEHLYRWYAEGLAAFTAPSHAAAAVYERLGERLHRLLGLPPSAESAGAGDVDDAGASAWNSDVGTDAGGAIDRLIADAAVLRAELESALAAGRDRLLELGSHRPTVSRGLVEAIAADDQDPTLRDYLNRFWDAFGIEHEPGRGGSTVLRPGAHMLEERFPGLPEDGLTACFDRHHALAHEDHAFLTREHPLVRTAMDLVTGAELGSTAVWLTRSPRFPAGALLLEVIAIADCPAPPELHAERFLPPTVLRLLLDERGRDLAGTDANANSSSNGHANGNANANSGTGTGLGTFPPFDPDRSPGRCLHNNRQLATALITARAKPIAKLIATAEPRLQAAVADLRQCASARMQQELANEIDRLQALAAVNPMVRPADVIALGERRDQLATALGQARLRLDALRLIAFT